MPSPSRLIEQGVSSLLLLLAVASCRRSYSTTSEALPDGGTRTVYAAEPVSRTPRVSLGDCYVLRDLQGRYAVLRFDKDFVSRLPNGQSTSGQRYTCIAQEDGSGDMGRAARWSGEVYETDALQIAFGSRDAGDGWFYGGKTQVECGLFHPSWSAPAYLYFVTLKGDARYEIAETSCTKLEGVNVFDKELEWKRRI
jgi:hypothetical protein